MTNDFSWTSRSNGGPQYNEGAWSSFMNTYNVGGTDGPTFGIERTYSWTITFNNYGRQKFWTAVDDSGSVYINGSYQFNMGGFNGQTSRTTPGYFAPGTYTISATSRNSGAGPWGIALDWYGYDPPIPSINSFTANPNPIIQGQCTTLSWNTNFGNLGGGSISGIGNVGFDGNGNGSTTVCPTSTTTYTLSVNNPNGSGVATSSQRTVTVYVPPQLFITASPSINIIAGNCVQLSWYITGDGDNLVWTSGGITNTNITSNATVCPGDTTTYSGYVTGNGGTSPETSITINVYQIPTITVNWPGAIAYDQQGIVSYTAEYANTSVQITATYYYYDSPSTTEGPINLTASGSPFLNFPNASVSSTYNTTIPYNNRGAKSVEYVIVAQGNGGTATASATIPILIDMTPDNLNIEESKDKIKEQEPIVTPETDILSEMFLVDDIDIDVEIKSNYPIQVDFNKDDNWQNVRQIGAVGGNSIAPQSFDPMLAAVHLENGKLTVKNSHWRHEAYDVPEEPTEYIAEPQVTGSFNWSNGTNNITIIQGQSATFSWYLANGITSASITNYGTLSPSGSPIYYGTRQIPRWYKSTAPQDHMCALSNPGGYSYEGILCRFFTSAAPGTFGGFDAEIPGVKPTSGLMGYVYPPWYNAPVPTLMVYEYVDSNGGPPNGLGTIWTTFSSGEGPYNIFIQSFKTPTQGYTDYSNVFFSGSASVSPSSTTTYTISGSGTGTYSKSITVTVLVPPTITFTVSPTTTIVAGQGATLSWNVNGDADTITWTQGNINNGNLNSSEYINPGDTTTYCAVASGIGGTSPNTCVTVTVLQPPTATITSPGTIPYNDSNFNIEYETKYATSAINITPTYYFLDGTSVVGNIINIPPATSSDLGAAAGNTDRNGVIDWDTIGINWGNFGPSSIEFVLVAEGAGSPASSTSITTVIIDQSPANVDIPESKDKLKEQEPIVTPETEITTEKLLIDDIDIPIEIHANYPILVDKNSGGTWLKVRQTGAAGVGGNSLDDEPVEIIHGDQFDGLENSVFYSDDPNEEAPLISKITNAQLAQLINCISIIDEVSPSVSTQQSDWTAFRNNFPYRTFWLLQAVLQSNGNVRYPLSRLNMPSNYLNDPYANGGIQVRRDDGNANFTSSWFDICQLAGLPDGTYVSLWIDISGSMTFSTIQASYNEFVTDCANNNINIILETSDSGERWIPGHNKNLPPSADFKIIDGNGQAVTTITVLAGSAVTLAWIVFGDVNNLEIIPGVINTSNSNFFYASTVVYPTQATTYMLTATGPEGDTNKFVQVNVLTPPEVFITANPGTSIITGQCTTLQWYVTGDADQIVWTQGNINNGNLTSNAQVCPGDTTTYCAKATGIAGDSPVTCITITVSQFPTCEISSPGSILYGDSTFDIEYESQYANSSITITPTYTYLNGTQTTGAQIIINPATSAELGGSQGATDRDGTIDWSTVGVPWNDFGPYLINWNISVQGTGGQAQDSTQTTVIIDQTPDNFAIPETKDKIKEQEPVETPETEILSELLLVDGIDIPVEIKSNYPIQVDINANDDWQDVRQI